MNTQLRWLVHDNHIVKGAWIGAFYFIMLDFFDGVFNCVIYCTNHWSLSLSSRKNNQMLTFESIIWACYITDLCYHAVTINVRWWGLVIYMVQNVNKISIKVWHSRRRPQPHHRNKRCAYHSQHVNVCNAVTVLYNLFMLLIYLYSGRKWWSKRLMSINFGTVGFRSKMRRITPHMRSP